MLNRDTTSGLGESKPLAANLDDVREFVYLIFRHAGPGGRVALRGFINENNVAVILKDASLDDPDFIERIAALIAEAANDPRGVVFSPPLAMFGDTRDADKGWLKADADNLKEGLTLSVECDENPGEACRKLEELLGPATVVVASGGEWTNPETGVVEPKLHLHWVLTKATGTKEEHDKLYKARELAGHLVGADGTGKPIVHPYRWPGSWHTKRQPARLVCIVSTARNEIDLDAALEKLSEACGDWGSLDEQSSSDPFAPPEDIEAAAEALPNPDVEYGEFRSTGLAFFRSSQGSDQGQEAYDKWSRKSSNKYGKKTTTEELWEKFRRYPPSRTGFGALVKRIRKTIPGWLPPSRKAKNSYEFVRASDIVMRAKNWLWRGHLLLGALELTTGIKGLGKSQSQCSFVACATTRKPWPDGTAGTGPVNVIMVTAEDTLDQDVRPRLVAAGADLNRVFILKKIKRDNKHRMFLLGEDIETLALMIGDIGDVGLVTLDPITAYMGKINSHQVTECAGSLGRWPRWPNRTRLPFPPSPIRRRPAASAPLTTTLARRPSSPRRASGTSASPR
jgi:hypothetical protein